MMNVTDSFRLFCEVWNLYKKYSGRKLPEKELNLFSEEVREIYEKYHSSFAKELLLAVVNEIGHNVDFFENG